MGEGTRRMFARLATWVTRHWVVALLVWVGLLVVCRHFAPNWDDVTKDGDFAYLPARMTSSRAEELLKRSFPELSSKSQVALIVARPGGRLHAEDFEIANYLADLFTPKEGEESPVTAVTTYQEPLVGRKLVSPVGSSGQATLVMLQLNNEFMAVSNMDFVRKVNRHVAAVSQQEDYPDGLQLGVTGSAAIGTDMLSAAEESIRNTEYATIGLVVLILLLVYRAPGLVIVPLLAIGVSFVLATDLLAMLAHWSDTSGWFDFRIFKTSKIFIVVILFGAATDYCLFLISRYREELERGLSPAEGIREALAQTGHALAASAATTILGLGAMWFADFGKFQHGGPAIAIALVVALAACLTAAPALLRMAGRFVFWPLGVKVVGQASSLPKRGTLETRPTILGRFWQHVANGIVAHPGLILVASFLVLAVPAYHGVNVPVTYDLLGELSSDRLSVQGMKLLEQYFPVGETGPITVLAYQPGAQFDETEGRRRISLLTGELWELTYTDSHGEQTRPILSVRSLTNPLGDPPGAFSPFTPAGRRKMATINHPKAKAMFLATTPAPEYADYQGCVTRLDLICRYDPFSKESTRLLGQIEERLLAHAADPNSPWHGASFDFTGITAGIRDLEAVNTSDYYRIGALVTICVLSVLILLLRRPLISLYLIFTVLFGYLVSLGISRLFFTWWYGDSYDGMDWKLPIFLFVILVAVGEDYNIYLVTRVFEEQRRRGLLEGLRVAVARTGGIITSCGVIMAGTFASMLTGTLRGMFELGFALSLGVLLDTFIIRTVLVPAFLALWARWFPGTASPAEKTEAGPPVPHCRRRKRRAAA